MPKAGVLQESTAVRIAGGRGADGTVLLDAVESEDDAVTPVAVGSTGFVGLEPLVLATVDGETAFVPQCTPDRLRSVVDAVERRDLPSESMAVVEHDADATALPVPETGPFAVGSRRILESVGWAVPASLADYRATRETLAAEQVADDPQAALDRVADSGVRGRGRGDANADVPIAEAWSTARETAGEPAVVVNANESDEHAAGDRLLLEGAPLAVLDGALAAARVVDATDVVVYCNESESLARERVAAAADALDDELDFEESVRVVTGPDDYRAGEPTMALEAIEGNHRLEARRGPPGPSTYGLDGRPTLVHTPRTLAQVARLLAGSDDEGLGGASSDPGTRLFSLAGDVATPATVELSTGAALSTAIPAVEEQDGRKAACVGGVFGGLTRSLDVPASAPGLTGAGLGTNGVVELLGESTCPVVFAGERAKFAREENCGRCVPCREGSKQLVDLLRDVYTGSYEDDKLRELTRVIRESSLCGFGRDAARPVSTAMERFETEFAAHAAGRCPTGACNDA